MKPVIIFKNLVLIGATISSFNALGYSDDKKKDACRLPKVQEFTLPEYSAANKKEAQPEAEFTFVVSGWANPKKFKLTAKNVDIPFTVQSTETFHKVKAKLLPEFTGETIRISARIPALLECYSTTGWLVKVAEKPGAVETPKQAEPATTTGAEGAPAPAMQEGTPAPTKAPSATPAPKAVAPAPATAATPPAAAPAPTTDNAAP
jgi:hypothetical protein